MMCPKKMNHYLALTIVGLFVGVNCALFGAEKTLLINGSFEEQDDKGKAKEWSCNFYEGSGNLGVISGNSANGEKCFRFDGGEKSSAQLSQRIMLKPGAYYLRFSYHGANGRASIRKTGEGNPSQRTDYVYRLKTEDNWRRITIPFLIERDDKARVYFSYSGGKGAFFLDKVDVYPSPALLRDANRTENIYPCGEMQKESNKSMTCPEGWQIQCYGGGAKRMISRLTTKGGRDGRKCLCLGNFVSGRSWELTGKEIPYERDHIYKMSFWLKTKNYPSGNIRFTCNGNPMANIRFSAPDAEWRKYSLYIPEGFLPVLETSFQPRIKIIAPKQNGKESLVYIDDVKVFKLKTGSKKAKSKILFPAGNFEEKDLSDWKITKNGNIKYSLDSTKKRTGKKSLKIELVQNNTRNPLKMLSNQTIALDKNCRYHLSAFRVDNGPPANINISLLFYDKNNKEIARLTQLRGCKTIQSWSTESWDKTMDWGLEIPLDAVKARILLEVNQKKPEVNPDKSIVWIDDVTLTAVPGLKCVMPSKPGANLLEGGNFETGMDHWHFFHRRAFINNGNNWHYRPPVFDASVKKEGLRSLRCDGHPGCKNYKLVFNPVLLPPGKFYTLSYWAKGTNSNKQSIQAMIEGEFSYWWHSAIVNVTNRLSAKWKKYSLTFAIPPGRKLAYKDAFQLSLTATPGKNGSIWLDGVSLHEGANAEAPARPFEAVEAGFNRDRLFGVYELGKQASVNLALYNQSNQNNLKVEVSTVDRYHKNSLGKNEFTVDLPKGASKKLDIPLFTKKRGSYYLKAMIKDQNGRELGWEEYAYIVIPYKKAVNVDYDSFLGLHHVVFLDWKDGDLLLTDPEDGYELCKKIGIKWVRMFNCWNVRSIDSSFDYTLLPIAQHLEETARKNGILIMPILGTSRLYRLPSFLLSNRKSTGRRPLRGDVAFMPDENQYRKYLRTVLTPFKGKITAWEVWNEPNATSMTPDEYLEVHKWTMEEIRKIDPEAKTIGMCQTGDLGLDMEKDMRNLVDKFKLKDRSLLSDIISVHGYGVKLDWTRVVGSINAMLKELQYEGKTPEIWNTEGPGVTNVKSVLSKTRRLFKEGRGSKTNVIEQANKIIQFSICQKGSNVKKWFHHGGFTGETRLDRCLMEYGGTPRPVLAAMSWFCETINNSTPLGIVPMEGGNIGFLFKNKGDIIFAAWNDCDEPSKMILPSSAPAFTLTGIMGNSEKYKTVKGQAVIELKNEVQYLIFRGSDEVAVRGALEKAVYPDAVKAKLLDGARLGKNDGSVIRVVVEGTDKSPVDATLNILQTSTPFAKLTNTDIKGVRLHEQRRVDIPINPDLLKNGINSMRLKLSAHGKSMEKNYLFNAVRAAPLPPRKIDGDISDWPQNSWNNIQQSRKTEGKTAKERMGRFAVAMDKNMIYFAIEYEDKTFRPHWHLPPQPIFRCDCVELFLDCDLEGDWSNNSRNNDEAQIICAPASPPSHNYKNLVLNASGGIKLEDIAYAFSRTPTGYIVECGIPLDKLNIPKDAKAIGLDFSIIDASQKGGEINRQYWAGSENDYSNPSLYGTLLFNR